MDENIIIKNCITIKCGQCKGYFEIFRIDENKGICPQCGWEIGFTKLDEPDKE